MFFLKKCRKFKHKNNGENNKSLLVMGDFNAHHRVWNWNSSDRKGKLLLEEMRQEELNIVNDRTMTHNRNIDQMNSNIDLVFSSQDIRAKFLCVQGKDLWGLDHWQVNIKLEWEACNYRKKSNKT